MSVMVDGFMEDERVRKTLFHFKRYRVTSSVKYQSYTVWYGGNILRITSNLKEAMNDFRNRIDEMKGLIT